MPLKLVGRLYEAVVPNPAGILMEAVPNVVADERNNSNQLFVFNFYYYVTLKSILT